MSERGNDGQALLSPYPWFGGKRRAAAEVWRRFGAGVQNYVEPFYGSGAVLLARPGVDPGRLPLETVNDLNAWLTNFWRAVQADPDAVARWADWPVSELDLHARGDWLFYRRGVDAEFIERLRGDPEYFDAKSAGWWVWGQCAWIGDNWGRTWHNAVKDESGEACGVTRAMPQFGSDRGVNRKMPQLTERVGIQRNDPMGEGVARQLPHVGRRQGIQRNEPGGEGVERKRPHLGNAGKGVNRQMPLLTERVGIHRNDPTGEGVARQRPHLGDRNHPAFEEEDGANANASDRLLGYMRALCERTRKVRVCCGDWLRVLGPSPTTKLGMTAVFLDPPYGVTDRVSVYGENDSRDVAADCLAWCLEHGTNPKLRIALCGYAGEHDGLVAAGWDAWAWTARGGYGSQRRNRTNPNSRRERIWFSPACLAAERGPLFAGAARGDGENSDSLKD